MLKIVEIGMFKCDHCKDRRKKPGVEFGTYGCDIQPGLVAVNAQTGERRVTSKGHRRIWREQLHLCLDHFKAFLADLIDEGNIGTWLLHKQAEMRPDFVNITYEEAMRLRREEKGRS